MATDRTTTPGLKATVAVAWLLVFSGGCEPSKPKPISPTTPPIETRKTIGKTTQNVMEISEAVRAGGVPAETEITGSGLAAITSDAYRTSVGKMGVIAVQHKLQIVEAADGPKPMGYEEFMKKVIGKGEPDGIQLPVLPYYQEWAYDAEKKTLVVMEFPLKKEQRQQETTGASGL
jgi:hypothetical protein